MMEIVHGIFIGYCLKQNKQIIKALPKQLWGFFLYAIGIIRKTKQKEYFFTFLSYLSNIEELIPRFVKAHQNRIKEWYQKRKTSEDIILTAEPEFLVKPFFERGIEVIGSRVNKKTGEYKGFYCQGKEKRIRLERQIKDMEIEELYLVGNYRDEALAKQAEKCFILEKEEIIPWEEYTMPLKKIIKKTFVSKTFFSFAIIGIIDTIISIGTSWLLSVIINANIAFMGGYILSISVGYLLNTIFVYKNRLNIHKYIKFCMSYIPNFIIQNVVVLLTYNILDIPNVVAYVIAALIGFPLTYLFVNLFAFGKINKEREMEYKQK